MSQVSINFYTNIYKDDVVNLIINIQRNEFLTPIELDNQPDLKEIDKTYQINKGNFWIAADVEKLVGTIGLIDIGNSQGALRKMFVAKEYRGKEFGVGQALLNNLIDWAKNKNIGELLLGTTEKFIGAQRFYEKNGFIEIQKKHLPEEFPIMDVDVKFYRFSVPG